MLNVFFVPRSDVRLMRTGTSAGPDPSVPAIVVARSLLHGADHLAGAGDFHRVGQAWQQRVHVGTRHRKLRRAEAVERMTEGVNAAALDVCNRAGRADLEIAAHERNANRITRAKRLWSRAVSLRERRHRGARHHGNEPRSLNADAIGSMTPGSNPPRVSGVAIGRSNVQARVETGAPKNLRRRAVGKRTRPAERLAERSAQAFRRQRHLQLDAGGRTSRGRKRRRLGHFTDRSDPAIGSFENCPREYETAPTSRPSI